MNRQQNMATEEELFAEIDCRQVNCHGDHICGDTFLQHHIRGQYRTVVVLSDGMGHGIKANILSTLTSSIIVNMAESNVDISAIAHTILRTLPVCSVRKLSYSTFTLLDIDHKSNLVKIVEYDNPQLTVLRGTQIMQLEWDCIIYDKGDMPTAGRTLLITEFRAEIGDRIVFATDGVTQSGLGSAIYPFGWGNSNLQRFITTIVEGHPTIMSKELSVMILNQAIGNDADRPHDDISCGVIYFRTPNRMLFCSCPPATKQQNRQLADAIIKFRGRKAVSGYILASIISQELNIEPDKNITSTDPEIPPLWKIDGIDLVTEGLITLSKALEILDLADRNTLPHGRGGAYRLCSMFLSCDQIDMIIGMKESSDTLTSWADDYGIRRKVITAIASLLEKKFAKKIDIRYF